ncbi:MAG: hypothetical protein ACQEWF_07545 [Bacillota bacterium]
MNYSKYGIDKQNIEGIIRNKLNENPDIFYYIDDYYMEKIVNSLIEGVSEAIYLSNKKIIENVPKIYEDNLRDIRRRRGIL